MPASTLGALHATAEVELPPAVIVDDVERAALLGLARLALAAAVGAVGGAELRSALEAFEAASGTIRRAAVFVTLTEAGELRGCIGTLDPSESIADAVAAAAVSAALHDPRFPPVTRTELPALTLEVSVLGPLVVLADPTRFRLGVDGLVVERGRQRGLLLPEVAATAGFDTIGMLDGTCRKAGLPPGAWRDHRTSVLAFRTTRFGGPAIAEPAPGRTASDRR